MGLSGLFLLSELNKWSNGEEIKMKQTERWLSLPAGHAGGEDDASDSVLPSLSLDRGEAEMDAGNKREGQRTKKRQNADSGSRWLVRE